MIHSEVWKECVYKCCHHRLIVYSTCILFPRCHNFSETEFKCFKNLQKARCGALTQFYKSDSRPFEQLSGDRATNVHMYNVSISKLQFMIFWAAWVDRERPWATKNVRSIRTRLLERGTWQIKLKYWKFTVNIQTSKLVLTLVRVTTVQGKLIYSIVSSRLCFSVVTSRECKCCFYIRVFAVSSLSDLQMRKD